MKSFPKDLNVDERESMINLEVQRIFGLKELTWSRF